MFAPLKHLAIAVIFFLGASTMAWADAGKDCTQRADHDRTIRGCTELVKADKLARHVMAFVYFSRARSYAAKNEPENALKDFKDAEIRSDDPLFRSQLEASIALLVANHRNSSVAGEALELLLSMKLPAKSALRS